MLSSIRGQSGVMMMMMMFGVCERWSGWVARRLGHIFGGNRFRTASLTEAELANFYMYSDGKYYVDTRARVSSLSGTRSGRWLKYSQNYYLITCFSAAESTDLPFRHFSSPVKANDDQETYKLLLFKAPILRSVIGLPARLVGPMRGLRGTLPPRVVMVRLFFNSSSLRFSMNSSSLHRRRKFSV